LRDNKILGRFDWEIIIKYSGDSNSVFIVQLRDNKYSDNSVLFDWEMIIKYSDDSNSVFIVQLRDNKYSDDSVLFDWEIIIKYSDDSVLFDRWSYAKILILKTRTLHALVNKIF